MRAMVERTRGAAAPSNARIAWDVDLLVGTPSSGSGVGVVDGIIDPGVGDAARVLAFVILIRRLSTATDLTLTFDLSSGDRSLRRSLHLGMPSSASRRSVLEDIEAALGEAVAEANAREADPASAFGVHFGEGPVDPSFLLCLHLLDRTFLLHYQLERFSRADAERLASIFESIVSRPELGDDDALAEFSLVDEAEAGLLDEINQVARAFVPVQTFSEMFAEQVKRSPDRIAVREGNREFTFSEIDSRSNQLAHVLRRNGVGPETMVGVFVDRSIETVLALLAVQKAGGAHVPLDPRYPKNRIAHVIADSEIRHLVTVKGSAHDLPFDGMVVCVDDEAWRGESIEAPAFSSGPSNLAYVIYTSGSTGAPKGVQIEQRQLANFFAGMDRIVERGEPGQEAWLAVTSISFDISIVELFWTLCRGITVVLHSPMGELRGIRSGRSDLREARGIRTGTILRQQRITHLQCTPSLASILVEDPEAREGLRGVRQWLVGGEALSETLARRMLGTGVGRVSNMYGPTETTVWSTAGTVGQGGVTVGMPLVNQEVHVLDEQRRRVPRGIPGELYIAGNGLARGYLRRPELTAERFVEVDLAGRRFRAYRTGDLVRMRADGNLEFLGRADHQVKVRGHRIEPGEIEAVLSAIPGISRAVVVAREVAGHSQLVAYVQPSGTSPLPPGLVRRVCMDQLPEVMWPAHVVVVKDLPLTPNGKIDRSRLPSPAASPAEGGSDPSRGGDVPRSPLERAIARAFEELLGYRPVHLDDDFFSMGGHSLVAVRLVIEIERETGVALPLTTLFSSSTVRAIAQRVEYARSGSGSTVDAAAGGPGDRERLGGVPGETRSLVRIRDGKGRPIFCVHGAGGNVLNFLDLSRTLETARPIFGLQARGVDGKAQPQASIEEMAADYLDEMRGVQPEGPYVVGGYSGGGIVAFEMARQLTSSGQEVDALFLLDTFVPRLVPRRPPFGERFRQFSREGAPYLVREFKRAIARRWDEWSTFFRVRDAVANQAMIPLELRDAWLTESFRSIADRYHLAPWHGKAVLFRAEKDDPFFGWVGFELGWKAFLPNLEVVLVPGEHDTVMLEPHVRTLASQMDEMIDSLG